MVRRASVRGQEVKLHRNHVDTHFYLRPDRTLTMTIAMRSAETISQTRVRDTNDKPSIPIAADKNKRRIGDTD